MLLLLFYIIEKLHLNWLKIVVPKGGDTFKIAPPFFLPISISGKRSYWGIAVLIAALLLIAPRSVYSQKGPRTDQESSFLLNVEQRLQSGRVMAIRDLANLWQLQPNNPTYKQLAQKYLLLTTEEFDWSTALPSQLLALFYQEEPNWKFSEFLTAFYLTPIEQRTVETILKEWHPPSVDVFVADKVIQNLETSLAAKDYSALRKNIVDLNYLEQAAADQVALTLIRNKAFLKIKPASLRSNFFQLIIETLSEERAIGVVFSLIEQKIISPTLSKKLLANLTNIYFEHTPVDSLKWAWNNLLKANNNNWILPRKKAFKQALSAQAIFFDQPVDYYAWILATTPKDTMTWIQDNALEDLLDTHDPKLLFYLAGLQFRDWRFSSEDTYLNTLQQLVDVRIAVKNQAGQLTYEYTDPVAQFNFMSYWSQHYEDYEWSEKPVGVYMNRRLKSELVDAYEKYFRRLNSSNDSVALYAFTALTEGLPEEVNRLMKKYRTLLRTYNPHLPPLKFSIIENICYLTDYCRQHNFAYHPSSKLSKKLNKLASDLRPKERLLLEEQLINELTLEELTVLEYYAIIKANNISLNYSIGRIVDYTYAKYWQEILQDEQQLRLFLLKNTLYKKLANFGIARLYHHRISNPSITLKQLLSGIEQSERNEFIREAIAFTKKEEAASTASVADFLKDPMAFKDQELSKISPLTNSMIPSYFQQLQEERNRKVLRKMGKYLGTFASTDLVPIIFKYSKEDWLSNKYSIKIVVGLLEKIYGYSFVKDSKKSLEQWYTLWEERQATYSEWGKYLFGLQLEELAQKEELRIGNINSITQSDFYQTEHREICLQALKKLKKTRTITQLQLQPALSISKELKHLEELDLSYRDLSNFTKILTIDNPQLLLQFILQKSADFPIDQKGFLYNNLLRQNWLYHLVDKHQMQEQDVYTLLENLITYLNESAYLTEFEEHTTQLNILLLTHYQSDLARKLAVLDDLSYDESVRLKWLDIIIARLQYEDIPKIITASKVIKDFDKAILFADISRDFGLPIYNWEETRTIPTFEQRLQTFSKIDCYKTYLEEFGIDITTNRRKLDFKKIHQLLEFDLAIPFIGEGGQYRDDYIYALIKVLELHFDTTLEFSPKLNEFQTFFQFNSFARAKAWKNYLIEHKHTKGSVTVPSSFKGEGIGD